MVEISVKEISERLAGQADQVAAMLLPGGKPENGKYWVCGDISGAPGKTLKVCIQGTYAGEWRDWANDTDKGDLLDLWRLTKGITAAEAVKQAKAYLGIVDPARSYERKTYSPPAQIVSSALNPAGGAMAYLRNKRGLTLETLAAFRIEGCAEKKAIVFPSFSPAGELVNRSYRTLEAKKRVWQDSGCAPSMFGWQALPEASYTARTVLLAEGQIDAMTWHQWGFPALSIPNGSGTTWIDYEWENLACFDTIYLAFDQDDAGRKITEAVASRLGKHRCLIVTMPKKDANECLMDGFVAGDAQEWVAAAKAPRIKDLVTGADMVDRLIHEIRPKEQPFTLPFLALNWHAGLGFWFRPGEVTVWGGWTGAGKSSMLNFVKSQLLAQATPIFEASLEMKVETTLRRMAKMFYGNGLNEHTARDFLKNTGTLMVFADIVGSVKIEKLMIMMRFAFARYGCQHFFIDSLMRIEDLEEDYPAQGQFCNQLQAFAKECNIHIHLVCHLAKPNQASSRPTMYGVKGSSLIINNTDNVVLICRNSEKEKLRSMGKLTDEQDKIMHDAELIVEKQRETGWTGMFKLRYEINRYRYTHVL